MVIITIYLKSNPQIQQFYFDKYADALKAAKLPTTDPVYIIHDDYNGRAEIDSTRLAAITVSDHNREMDAHEQVDKNKIGKDIRVNKWAQASAQSGIVQPQVIRQN